MDQPNSLSIENRYFVQIIRKCSQLKARLSVCWLFPAPPLLSYHEWLFFISSYLDSFCVFKTSALFIRSRGHGKKNPSGPFRASSDGRHRRPSCITLSVFPLLRVSLKCLYKTLAQILEVKKWQSNSTYLIPKIGSFRTTRAP